MLRVLNVLVLGCPRVTVKHGEKRYDGNEECPRCRGCGACIPRRS